MTRPTKQELWDRLARARSTIPLGNFFRHQASGDVYEVTKHSIREHDGEVLITYRTVFGVTIDFTRPMVEFFELVDLPGGSGPRFRYTRWEDAQHG